MHSNILRINQTYLASFHHKCQFFLKAAGVLEQKQQLQLQYSSLAQSLSPWDQFLGTKTNTNEKPKETYIVHAMTLSQSLAHFMLLLLCIPCYHKTEHEWHLFTNTVQYIMLMSNQYSYIIHRQGKSTNLGAIRVWHKFLRNPKNFTCGWVDWPPIHFLTKLRFTPFPLHWHGLATVPHPKHASHDFLMST